MLYTKSALEDWVTDQYTKNHIKTAQDIDIAEIARIYSIFIHYRPMPARYDIYGRYKAIILDVRKPSEQFFHELCHILRHVGHQSMLPKAFRELQEWDANNFTMYAALPYFMVKQYDFEDPYLIHHLAIDFKITEDLCKKRIEQIKRNFLYNKILVAESNQMYNKA